MNEKAFLNVCLVVLLLVVLLISLGSLFPEVRKLLTPLHVQEDPADAIQGLKQLQFEEERASLEDDPFYNPCISPRQQRFIDEYNKRLATP